MSNDVNVVLSRSENTVTLDHRTRPATFIDVGKDGTIDKYCDATGCVEWEKFSMRGPEVKPNFRKNIEVANNVVRQFKDALTAGSVKDDGSKFVFKDEDGFTCTVSLVKADGELTGVLLSRVDGMIVKIDDLEMLGEARDKLSALEHPKAPAAPKDAMDEAMEALFRARKE